MPLDTISLFRQFMARAFALLFFLLSVVLLGVAAKAVLDGLGGSIGVTEAYLRAINSGVVGLAMFELGLVVLKEYAVESSHDVITMLRRTVPRFVAMACVALVLEGLLMVIKYSQLELAGNLVYPVAIIASSALLLLGLGAFLRFSEQPAERAPAALPARDPGHPLARGQAPDPAA